MHLKWSFLVVRKLVTFCDEKRCDETGKVYKWCTLLGAFKPDFTRVFCHTNKAIKHPHLL